MAEVAVQPTEVKHAWKIEVDFARRRAVFTVKSDGSDHNTIIILTLDDARKFGRALITACVQKPTVVNFYSSTPVQLLEESKDDDE